MNRWRGNPEARDARLSQVLRRYKQRCANPLCRRVLLRSGPAENKATLDHTCPLHRGGTEEEWNLRPLCPLCHWRLNLFDQCMGAVACSFVTPRNNWVTRKIWEQTNAR